VYNGKRDLLARKIIHLLEDGEGIRFNKVVHKEKKVERESGKGGEGAGGGGRGTRENPGRLEAPVGQDCEGRGPNKG